MLKTILLSTLFMAVLLASNQFPTSIEGDTMARTENRQISMVY